MKRTVLLLLFTMLLLTGCWDYKDIESRGFVLGIAIDKYPPTPQESEKGSPDSTPPEEEEKLEKMELHTGEPAYAMTIQLPVIKGSQATNKASGGGGGSSEGAKTWEITQVGNSFMSMNREMLSRTGLTLYYEHLQVIIISEEVARNGLENIMDFFIRDPEMRRRVKVFISQQEAKSILDVQPRIEDYSAIYLAKMPENSRKNSRMAHKTDLGEAINNIHRGHDFILPKVVATKDEIKTSGAAAFKEGKMVGWISELELEAIKFIRNLYLGGVVTVQIPGEKTGSPPWR